MARYPLCSHLLTLKYPDTALLPPDRRPYLEVPQNVGYRERPQLGTFHLSSTNLAFFLQFEADQTNILPEPLDDETNQDITKCVCWLSSASGVSELSAVSFFAQSEDDIITRLCLRTTWFIGSGKVQEQEKCFEFSSGTWNMLQCHTNRDDTDSWINLMNDLMLGISDRAVLHRLQLLDAYDPDFADEEEESWTETWDERPGIDPPQLLANNLEVIGHGSNGSEIYAPMVSLSLYEEDQQLHVRLPCYHETDVTVGAIKALSMEGCATSYCQQHPCNKRKRTIMDHQSKELLKLALRKNERASWAIDQIDWERLDHDPQSRPTSTSISGDELYESLKLALASMKAPVSATPAAMDPTGFRDAKLIRRHFKRILCSQSISIQEPPRKVLLNLQQEAGKILKEASPFDMATLQVMLPPGFVENFLCKWLQRAVNYAMPSSIGMNDRDLDSAFADVLTNMRKVALDTRGLETSKVMENVEMYM